MLPPFFWNSTKFSRFPCLRFPVNWARPGLPQCQPSLGMCLVFRTPLLTFPYSSGQPSPPFPSSKPVLGQYLLGTWVTPGLGHPMTQKHVPWCMFWLLGTAGIAAQSQCHLTPGVWWACDAIGLGAGHSLQPSQVSLC